jgi:hypothetical protein
MAETQSVVVAPKPTEADRAVHFFVLVSKSVEMSGDQKTSFPSDEFRLSETPRLNLQGLVTLMFMFPAVVGKGARMVSL